MSEQPATATPSEDRHSALFANLVLQQSNMAMMFLGRTPNPETGQPTKDLEAARMFIDTLEMLEARTQGNLSEDEAHLLKESLTALRLAFVEAANEPAEPSASASSAGGAESTTSSPAPEASVSSPEKPEAGDAPPPAEESRKKFVKKY